MRNKLFDTIFSMQIQKYFGVEGAKQSKGVTIIIDVFRAATVTAFLLDKGVKEIIPVATKEEAFALKEKDRTIILVGETHGYKIDGFDYGNSPSEISRADNLEGKTVVHRSSQGTQGIVLAKNATEIIFGSFVCASAIVKYLQTTKPPLITIIAMDGVGSEDDIYADFLIAKLKNAQPDNMKKIVKYLQKHPGATRFLDPSLPEFPEEDFYLCLDVDRFDFIPLISHDRIVKYVLH